MSAIRIALTLRNDCVQSLITRAGAGAKLKGYSGAAPAGVSPVVGANTLLCQASFGAAIGVVAAGALDWDEAGAVQVPANFMAGTPVFFDLTTSADAVVQRYELNVQDGWPWNGNIVVGQPFALSQLLTTAPGAL